MDVPQTVDAALDPDTLAEFCAGRAARAWRMLGAHPQRRGAAAGVRFAVWAPNAAGVSVVGDFNGWTPEHDALRPNGDSGVWSGFVPDVPSGAHYKYAVRTCDGRTLLRTDPYARAFERRPGIAARVPAPSRHRWTDRAWMRARPDWRTAPMAIYEVHAGSWRRSAGGGFLGYRALARALTAHLAGTGFTHVELLPVCEHPHDASWGYQCIGMFAPTSRYGDADDLRAFVDWMHGHGYGVILDWVPAHFPRDDGALARFDGTPTYEHADAAQAHAPHWDTLYFDCARAEVRSFLVSSALYWLEEFHVDGLRIDAVASMLYLDYGRADGGWTPNAYGGRENLAAVDLLQALNTVTHGECPGTFTIAEESSAWPGVSRPVWLGGLGFSMKWNMGWMHDTLRYLQRDPVHRSHHHDELTFSRWYAFDENFVLPLSHDEVVHGKRTLLGRMPGDDRQRCATLRLLYALQFCWPGKKLLFMGQEFGASAEWDEQRELDWREAAEPAHAAVFALVSDLSRAYRDLPALHRGDFEPSGFEWLDCRDAAHSVLAFARRHGRQRVAILMNFTPVARHGYRIGLPVRGRWRERINTDSRWYGGSDVGNGGAVHADGGAWHGQPCSAVLTLPPLGALVLQFEETLPCED